MAALVTDASLTGLASLSRLTPLDYVVDGKVAVTKLLNPEAKQERILLALKVSLPSL